MNNRKIKTILRPIKSRSAYESHYLVSQLNKLTKEEKHAQIWTWVKQGVISYSQFCFILRTLEKSSNE